VGNEMTNNLKEENIFLDCGEIPVDVAINLEYIQNIKLPKMYTQFIIKHNGADLKADVFDYIDPNIGNKQNSNGIAFVKIETIRHRIENIQSGEEPDWDIKYRFEDGLIPFGDNGGGDLICFDYRKNRDTNDPPIVIWNHDMGLEHRVVFIANNFEDFINMLHEPED
jgi:hypothetical protein